MAMAAVSGAPLVDHPSHCSIRHDLVKLSQELIVTRTGRQPVDFEHLYNFQLHLNDFVHPNPRVPLQNERFGTIPIDNANTNIVSTLRGWTDLSAEEAVHHTLIFNRYTEEDRKKGLDEFFLEQGRAPTVPEFSRYLLILEGKLFLRSKELENSVDQNMKTIEMLNEILCSKDIINETLGQADIRNRREILELKEKIEDLNLRGRNIKHALCQVQQERTQLQLDKNQLRDDVKELKKKNKQLRKDNEEQLQNMKKMEEEKVQLEECQRRLEEFLDSVDSSLVMVEDELHRVQAENDALAEKLSNVVRDNDRLTQNNDRLTQDKDILAQDKDRLAQTLSNVTQDKDRLAQTLSNVTQDKDRLAQDKDRLAQTLSNVTQDRDRMAQELRNKDMLYKFIILALIFAFILSVYLPPSVSHAFSSS